MQRIKRIIPLLLTRARTNLPKQFLAQNKDTGYLSMNSDTGMLVFIKKEK